MGIVPSMQARAQWLCDLEIPGRDLSSPAIGQVAQVLFTSDFLNRRKPLSEKELTEVQEIVARGLAALRKGKRWYYKTSAVIFLEPVRSGGIGSGGGVKLGWQYKQKEVFIAEAMRILAEAKDRLRVCGGRDCDRLIYAVKRQEYCSACAKETRKRSIAEWRTDHPEQVRKWAKAHYQRRKKRQAAKGRKKAR